MTFNKFKKGILKTTYNSYDRSHYLIWVMYPGSYDISIRYYFTTTKNKSCFRRHFTLKSHKHKTEYVISFNRAAKLIKQLFVMKIPLEVISRIGFKTKKFERIYLDKHGNIIQILESNQCKYSDHCIDDIFKIQNSFMFKIKTKIKNFLNYENYKKFK